MEAGEYLQIFGVLCLLVMNINAGHQVAKRDRIIKNYEKIIEQNQRGR